MRNCKRNQRTITYSLYGAATTTDEWGNEVKSYGDKVETTLSISPATGETSEDVFGVSLDYDMVLTTFDMKCPIDEYSKVWIDGEQYKVKKKAKNLNTILYAVKRVEAPHEDN